MFRVAAHPLCAVTPQARLALREPCPAVKQRYSYTRA